MNRSDNRDYCAMSRKVEFLIVLMIAATMTPVGMYFGDSGASWLGGVALGGLLTGRW